MSERLAEQLPEESELVDKQLKEGLKQIFQKLERPLCLKAVLDPEQKSSREMGSFLKAIAALSPLLQLELLERGEDVKVDNVLDTEHLPATGFFQEEAYLGVAFYGIPGGKEINSFAAAICYAAGHREELEPKLAKRIRKLKKKNVIQIFVSLSCQHCQKVVVAGQRLALLSPNVECAMIDARLYPDLVEQYQITRVPVILIGQAMYFGEKDIDGLLPLLR